MTDRRTLVLVVVLLALPLAAGSLTRPPVLDEPMLLAAAQGLAANPSWGFVRTYDGHPSSSGPLYLLVHVAWGTLFGLSLPALRAFSVGASLVAVVSLDRVLRLAGWRPPFWVVPAAALAGYYYAYAFTVMTEVPVLAALALGTACFAAGVLRRRPWLHLAAGAAWLYAADGKLLAVLWIGAAGAWLLLRGERHPAAWAAVVAPVALRLSLVLVWGEPLPPTWRLASAERHVASLAPGLHWAFLNHGLALLGLYAWPVLLGLGRETGRRWPILAVPLALLPLYLLAMPDYGGVEYAGLVRSALAATGQLGRSALILALPWAAGCAVLAVALRAAWGDWRAGGGPGVGTLLGCVLLLTLLPVIGLPLAWDRYLMPMLVPALLLGARSLRDRRLAGLVLAANVALVTAVYAAAQLLSVRPGSSA